MLGSTALLVPAALLAWITAALFIFYGILGAIHEEKGVGKSVYLGLGVLAIPLTLGAVGLTLLIMKLGMLFVWSMA